MPTESRISTLSSLSRFRLKDEHLVADELVKAALTEAFDENRCFPFIPDADLVDRLRLGDPAALYREQLIAVRNKIFDDVARDDQTVKNRLLSDIRLSSRIMAGLMFIHRALAEGDYTTLADRRFVLIKEKHSVPTLYHISNETTVISHVGQGPQWQEIPSVYLGLNIFDALNFEIRKGGHALYDAFKSLLVVEERAIETGYSHIEIFPPEVSAVLNLLVDEVINVSTRVELEYKEILIKRKVRKFTEKSRQRILQLLDARLPGSMLNFNYGDNINAIEKLEKFARIYKRGDDPESLREVVRLLVAASGHDIHEVRDRANILLERIFSPKEFDAPLAAVFVTIPAGSEHVFEFDLAPGKAKYLVRIYKNCRTHWLTLESDLDYVDVSLEYNESKKRFTAVHRFQEYGHYDFVVFTQGRKKNEWVQHSGTSGRVNVIPDVRGEIILEIFPDIHGHTKTYWMDSSGHPGLVYNEHGEVIRLGKFSDISAHLEDLKQRYCITALYLLGVQMRGSNREDWAPEASSPSPFSPMSMVEIEPSLGGEAEFRELVKRAHSLDIKIIVDIVPHLNRRSSELPDSLSVQCYDDSGALVVRASTDGRFGSWNDGKLLNYRRLEIWEWLAGSITALIDRYDIDGIRFDSAHAVPIMMKKNNFPMIYEAGRSVEDMVEGTIIVNDREDDHLVTTGYYDSACRDVIAIPLHYYLMSAVERKLKEKGKTFFINIAECYWGHERFLTRVGIIPYNSALFKICENIIHGKTDVREIYHIYDNYFPSALPRGTELLGILGNHDERRALNTFGHRGLRAAVGITTFMNNIIMDYEGSVEGEGWKVFLDNIFVNWNQFEYAAHRSVERFYLGWYNFHRQARGRGYLLWADNTNVVASMKFTGTGIWIGIFNFAESNQSAAVQFDNPVLPIEDDVLYRVVDTVYFTGRELKTSKLYTVVSFTDRVKLLQLEVLPAIGEHYDDFLRDSFFRLCTISRGDHFRNNFSFREFCSCTASFETLRGFVSTRLVPLFWEHNRQQLELGLMRSFFHAAKNGGIPPEKVLEYIDLFAGDGDEKLRGLGESLRYHNQRDSLVFMSAEADPFSKSGGLANVVYELPRELAKLGENVYVITGFYRNGDEKSMKKMHEALEKYRVKYTGINVRFKIRDADYEVGVHRGEVDGVTYLLLDHFEFFDGLYWGVTSEEKLRRRIAFARACAEVIATFGLRPLFTFTNDAYTGLFNGIVRSDHVYASNPNFARTTFLHVIHNGGWQYFDAYHRWEKGADLFGLFNLPQWRAGDFADPVHGDRLNCMATGLRFADRVITVSPTYAKQIEFASDGMERILRNVIGISNAIGGDFKIRINTTFKKSGFVESRYPLLMERIRQEKPLEKKIRLKYPELLEGVNAADRIKDPVRRSVVQRLCRKLMLQMDRGLRIDPDAVLVAMIHRITEQKGFQLLLDSSEGVINRLGFQFIIGGSISSGDNRGEEIAHGLYLLSQYYHDRVWVSFGFQDISIPLLSADLFCMPSQNEPGGISQLEAFAAGCLVVARTTGGLRDTVFPIIVKGREVEGNGFLFSDYTPSSFYDAMERTSHFFKTSDDELIYGARRNAENSVYYWDRPAKKYIEEIYNLKEIIRII